MKPIVRGNVVVWPRHPAADVKRTNERASANPDTDATNVAVLPVIQIVRFSDPKPEPTYNDIQDVVARTMRGQRATKHNPHVIEKLRAMFKYPA